MTRSAASTPAPLDRLCEAYGVQRSYEDAFGRTRRAPRAAVVKLLRALGAPIRTAADAERALRRRAREAANELCPPVAIAWHPRRSLVPLNLRPSEQDQEVRWELAVEGRPVRRARRPASRLPAAPGGVRLHASVRRLAVPLPRGLPLGYHHLRVRVGRRAAETLVVSAPRKAYAPPRPRPAWAVLAPLYAVRSRRNWGSGDFTDLQRLAVWLPRYGGSVVGTLPLLPTHLASPYDPSPYAPISRAFWSEFYLDIEALPEFRASRAARRRVASPAFQRRLREVRASPLVQYRDVQAIKRRVLDMVVRDWHGRRGAADPAFRRFLEAHPRVPAYARFRAALETRPMARWPSRMRRGDLRPGDVSGARERLHLYAQWAAHRQLGRLRAAARRAGVGLYLDLPLGTHADSFDVWGEPAVFARSVGIGAPPDYHHRRGQDWGFPPPRPEGLRRSGYRLLRDALAHHMAVASFLRIDHVMGFHRLFWVPRGHGPRDGAYVHYPWQEIYAILLLESHRWRCEVVGEDLGTVPPEVRAAMRTHGLHRSYVLQRSIDTRVRPSVVPPPANSVAALNTHDMAPFAAYWAGLDIDDQLARGALTPVEAGELRRARGQRTQALARYLRRRGFLRPGAATSDAMLHACLTYLSRSAARLVLVNLEDLWLELQPQNRPGTGPEWDNWRRKFQHGREELSRLEALPARMRLLERRGGAR